MELLGILIILFLLPMISVVLPAIYADKKSKDMLDDLNSNPTDYTE